MGQVQLPQGQQSLILTAVDRLIATNADGGIGPGVSHIILLGETAGRNLAISNAVGLGFNALGGAGTGTVDSVKLDGSIAIGQSAGGFIETGGGAIGQVGGNILLGRNAVGTAQFASANVVIGNNALGNALPVTASPITRNVYIGRNAGLDANSLGGIFAAAMSASVVIGDNAARPNPASAFGPRSGITGSVILGDNAANNFTTDGVGVLSGVVCIGPGAGLNINMQGNGNLAAVILGRNAGVGLQSPACTILGDSATVNGLNLANQTVVGANSVGNSTNNTVLGSASQVLSGALDSICIGAGATVGQNSQHSISLGSNAVGLNGVRNILIGDGVGNAEPAASADTFILETVVAAVRRGLLYGNLASGNLIVGKSTPGVDRDFSTATNSLKILNGTPGAVAPLGGGRLFGTAGELGWFSTAGVQYALTPSASRGIFTVATLPVLNLLASQRAYVTDALAPAFGVAVAGGGAAFVPVFYDGAAWIVG